MPTESSASQVTIPVTAPLTMDGTILGTIQYMAPEALEGTEAGYCASSGLGAISSALLQLVDQGHYPQAVDYWLEAHAEGDVENSRALADARVTGNDSVLRLQVAYLKAVEAGADIILTYHAREAARLLR